jgi:hypothetical protein
MGFGRQQLEGSVTCPMVASMQLEGYRSKEGGDRIVTDASVQHSQPETKRARVMFNSGQEIFGLG